jgi:hypothetical protein
MLGKVLCGIDEEGDVIETEEDSINLLSEIKASQEGKVFITLPDDDNPANEDGKVWRLILSVRLISLDWLANGAFGPFAESVSANRPCFKCMWTDKCGCAWIARTDKRNETIVHSALCRRKRARTHTETLEVVLGAAFDGQLLTAHSYPHSTCMLTLTLTLTLTLPAGEPHSNPHSTCR